MKFSVIAENFQRPLSFIERNTAKNLTLPILGSFFISTEGGLIKIIGTNLEIGVEALIRGTIQQNGKVVVPAKNFLLFISTIKKDEKITLESSSNDLVVEINSQKTIFKGLPPEDFPPFPIIRENYSITFKKDDIVSAVTRCLISVSRSLIKPELSSIFFLVEKEIITIASTDSFRLSEVKIKPSSYPMKIQKETFLLPERTGEEVLKLLELSNEDKVKFCVGRGEIVVKCTDMSLYSRLIEGGFPEYGQIIPMKFQTSAKISRPVIVGHLRRASLFTNKLNGISITIEPQKKTGTIESTNRDVGEYKASFHVDAQGEPLSIVFNYHYLIDGIDGFKDDVLFFGFNGEAQPLLIRPPQKDELMYVVMPMKGGV